MILFILFAALLPIAILGFFILRKDSKNPEPAGQLVKAFLFGALSVLVSFCISTPLQMLGLFVTEPSNLWEAFMLSFFGAAIPEEIAKLLMLLLFLKKCRDFNEKMDGIVYAVCVSLGFAALENIMYLFSYSEAWLSVGISRAIFAVPGHFCFGVLMGYYFSLAKFYPLSPRKNTTLILAAPIIAHGIYDTIAFSSDIMPAISGLITILLIFFCFKMWKYASKSIADHLRRDGIINDRKPDANPL